MSVYRQQVREVLRATHFQSALGYSWFGQRSEQLLPRMRRALTPQAMRGYLLLTLQRQLYADFYCHGAATPTPNAAFVPHRLDQMPLVPALSAANGGVGLWETGWRVRSVAEDEVWVRKGTLQLRARREECRPVDGERIEVGCEVSVSRGKELLGISPGFYLALGDRRLSAGADDSLVRLYWHLTAEGATPLVRVATRLLNAAELPFHLKVTNDPSRFTRCDAAVLYMRQRDYPIAARVLTQVYGELAAHLRPAVPALTKPLAPGLGLAEDPAPRDSFGLHRCRLFADALIQAFEQGARSLDARLRVVEERFAAAGVSLDTPYLNPGAADVYAFVPVSASTATFTVTQRTADANVGLAHAGSESALGGLRGGTPLRREFIRRPPDADRYLRVASDIGRRLVDEAFWYDGRCTWIGADAGAETAEAGRGGAYRALGPEVYAGTSGVALFLAELYAATGERETNRTARGAVRQALAGAGALSAPERLGLYTGWPGIALVAAHSALLLDDDELLLATRRMAKGYLAADIGGAEHDLVFGKAGAIVALLALHPLLDDPELLAFAARLGDALIASAQKTDVGYSWRWERSPYWRNLTGLSHGAAGIAAALFELAEATGEVSYREAAECALDYERHWFDAAARNWPDFRTRQRRYAPQTFASAWCHGAPGIALSRLRAYELTGDASLKGEAQIALATTRASIEAQLAARTGNFSLCHGLAGNAAILLRGALALDEGREESRRVAHMVADSGVALYAKQGAEWDCGTPGGYETPGLLLGLAGIGYFYLALCDASLPSILLPQSGAWGRRLRAPAVIAQHVR